MKKFSMLIMTVLMVGTLSLIGDTIFSPVVVDADNITDRIQNGGSGSNTEQLTNSIDEAGGKIVGTAREIGLIVVFVLIIWIGYVLWFSGSSQGIAAVKGRLALLFGAIIFVFFTEEIVGAIFGLLGKDISEITGTILLYLV